MFARIVTFSVLISTAFAAITNPNHFGQPCTLCECFVEYSDREVGMGLAPYRVAGNAYEITEDQCLAGCLQDGACKMAVYGFTGGRSIFTCEYYGLVDVKTPIYAPYTNIYLKKMSGCKSEYNKFKPIGNVQDDAMPEIQNDVKARKGRLFRVHHQQTNPFNVGK